MKNSPRKTIVCGTDFSANAQGAANAAAALARIGGKTLTLFHVSDEDEPTEAHAAARRQLHDESVRLADTGVSVNGELLLGEWAGRTMVEEVALRPDVELLVVSPVSKTAIDRWTLGSVSEAVAESAPVPTLVVRQPDIFVDWAAGHRLLKVLVAADFSDSAREALRWAAGLRSLGSCQLTAAYVNWPPAERERLGVGGPLDLTANSPEIQQVLERDFREMVGAETGGETGIIVQPGWGRVDAHLVGLAVETGADLLVVGTHHRMGLERWTRGSVSRGILRHAPMNVACVPVQGAPAMRRCRRVLAAVDLEKSDSLALPMAYSIVSTEGAVFLLNVKTPPGAAWQDDSEAVARLEKVIPVGTGGVRTEVLVEACDDVVQGICEAAETNNVDIVCVGAHTRPGVAARLLGSVALGVLQKCRRPVLVVWPED